MSDICLAVYRRAQHSISADPCPPCASSIYPLACRRVRSESLREAVGCCGTCRGCRLVCLAKMWRFVALKVPMGRGDGLKKLGDEARQQPLSKKLEVASACVRAVAKLPGRCRVGQESQRRLTPVARRVSKAAVLGPFPQRLPLFVGACRNM
ncbi:hypothetical protein BDP81DRAFT_177432 [Colletotrichum phormii]|uniref:Uncharacterized protein n=1 Tax=Colletotrichum phormii TaxID=359342 RepID=A0AAI9ZWE7_9PEZI|nr:uncharacterized protein BDP81DRAFT_177432 [Colletotrichum phormii]KAK1639455.1 hypothetical protein BDP81DRAFT_177432 [Colletotrichum phormii]